MKPATRLTEIAPGLQRWSSFHTEWKVDFSSYAIQTDQGVIFVDPVKPSPAVQKKLAALGAPVGVFLTNSNHARDADWFRKTYEIQVYAHEKAPTDCETKIDVLLLDGEKLAPGLQVLQLPGASSGEAALFFKSAGAVLVGDTLLNSADKGLAFLPDDYCADPKQLRRSAQKLLALNFQTITFAHGEPIVGDAKKNITAFLKAPRKKK